MLCKKQDVGWLGEMWGWGVHYCVGSKTGEVASWERWGVGLQGGAN